MKTINVEDEPVPGVIVRTVHRAGQPATLWLLLNSEWRRLEPAEARGLARFLCDAADDVEQNKAPT